MVRESRRYLRIIRPDGRVCVVVNIDDHLLLYVSIVSMADVHVSAPTSSTEVAIVLVSTSSRE